ncbi:MAG: S1 family peptidase [Thermoanaerobaculia bacterium]
MSAISNEGRANKLPGSGVFIAPYLGLTAKHVIAEVKLLHERSVESGTRMDVDLKLHQTLTLDPKKFVDEEQPSWHVTEVIECPYSDLALLQVVPANLAAERLTATAWSNAFFRLRLLPPPVDGRIRALGFSAVERSFNENSNMLEATSTISLSEGRVCEVFPNWITEPRPPAPDILGGRQPVAERLTDFPCFQTTAPIDGGMSGGPVFSGNDLVGIVSTGLDIGGGEAGDDLAQSRAATLWPLLFTKNISTGLDRVSFGALLRSAFLNCVDWREAEETCRLEEHHGISRAVIS